MAVADFVGFGVAVDLALFVVGGIRPEIHCFARLQ